MSHFTYALLLAGLVSTATAFSEKRPACEQVYRAGYVFVCCILLLVAGGWIMLAIHG